MRIILNNRDDEFSRESLSVSQLLELRKLSFRMRIIKINGHLIPREKYDSTTINDGDKVQVIYLMSGG